MHGASLPSMSDVKVGADSANTPGRASFLVLWFDSVADGRCNNGLKNNFQRRENTQMSLVSVSNL